MAPLQLGHAIHPYTCSELLAQQSVELEAAAVAIEDAQQRAAHEGVGGFVGFLFAEFGDLGGEGEPEAFLHAYGIVVPALRRAARVVERGTRRLSVGRKAGPSVRS